MADHDQALFAIVEIFGHQRIAGRISEQTFGGASFVRVDVPEVSYLEWEGYGEDRHQVTKAIPAHTRSFGPAAIYAINWCDETAAVMAANQIRDRPITTYDAQEVLRAMKPDDVAKLLRGGTRDLLPSAEGDGDVPF